MHIPIHLGEPLGVQHLRDNAGFVLGEHEPIAIVVMPGIELIQLEQSRRFIGRADGLAIPLDDVINAIGVCVVDHDHHVVAGTGKRRII